MILDLNDSFYLNQRYMSARQGIYQTLVLEIIKHSENWKLKMLEINKKSTM